MSASPARSMLSQATSAWSASNSSVVKRPSGGQGARHRDRRVAAEHAELEDRGGRSRCGRGSPAGAPGAPTPGSPACPPRSWRRGRPQRLVGVGEERRLDEGIDGGVGILCRSSLGMEPILPRRSCGAVAPVPSLLSFSVGPVGRSLCLPSDSWGARESCIRYEIRSDEGPSFRKADVREVQGHPPQWRGPGDLPEPAPQAAAGLGAMARIAGVNIPVNKRIEIGLTYIFGIGHSTAQKILAETEDRPEHPGQGPDRGRGHQAARGGRAARGRGRPAPRALPERQTADGDRLLPRPAPPPRPAGPRPADEDQRARPQGPAPDERRRQAQGAEVGETMAAEKTRQRARPPPRQKERHLRAGAHQDFLQQHDRHPDRHRRQRDRLGVGRLGRASKARASRPRSPPR